MAKKKKLRLKKSVKKALKVTGYTTALVLTIGIPNMVNVFADAPENSVITNTEVPVYKINTSTLNPSDRILSDLITQTENVDPETTDLKNSNIEYSNLNVTKAGIQVVNINANIANKDTNETTNVNQQAVVVVQQTKYPTLKLTQDEITIDNDGSEKHFLPEQYISYIHDTASNTLPALTIEGADKVNLSQDGYYTVKYTAVNKLGYTAEKVLTVHVQTPEWLIAQRAQEAAAQAQAEAEEQARIEEEQKAAEEARLETERIAKEQENINSNLNYSSGSNPYPGGWSNCTYGAWQALYNARGIALPNLGNASSWYSNAASLGYHVSSTPTAGGIAVYNGHVAYVDSVNGNSVHIVEGGFNGHYNERWVSVSGTGTKSTIGYINL